MTQVAKDFAETVSAVLAALTALGAAVALLGGALILIRLNEIGLPGDLGVVASLPGTFVLATGLSYVGLPTVLALVITAMGAYIVRPRQGHRWLWSWGPFTLIALCIAVAFCIFPLVTTLLEHGPVPVAPLATSIAAGIIVAFCFRSLWDDPERGAHKLKSVVGMMPTFAAICVTILVWSFIGATQRGGFPRAQVCTVDAGGFQGYLISETADNVFIGEPKSNVDVVAYGRPDSTFGEVVDDAASGVNDPRSIFTPRAPIYLSDASAVPPERADVIIIQARRALDIGAAKQEALAAYDRPVLALGASDASTREGLDPAYEPVPIDSGAEPEGTLEEDLDDQRTRQRIVSIPSSSIARTFIQTNSDSRAPTISACPATGTSTSSASTSSAATSSTDPVPGA